LDKLSESKHILNHDIIEKFKEYHSNHYDPGFKRLNNLNKLTDKRQIDIDNNYNNNEKLTNNYYNINYNDTEQIMGEDKKSINDFNDEIKNAQRRNLNNYEVMHRYSIGINIDNSSNNSICYHKVQKWFAYIFDNKIVIEDFHDDKYRNQLFLEDSKYKLSAIKLSSNNHLLMAFSSKSFNVEKRKDKEFDFSDLTSYNVFEEESLNNNQNTNTNNKIKVKIRINPYIFIWDCKELSSGESQIPVFKNITKLSIKHNKIHDCEFSPLNNLCIFSSKVF